MHHEDPMHIVGGCPANSWGMREKCLEIRPFGCCLDLAGMRCDEIIEADEPCNIGDGYLTCPFYDSCV